MSADAAPGIHALEGAIDQPGEQDRYDFTVQERTRFLFDGIQGTQIQWQLQGPNSTDQFSTRNLTDIADPFLDLDPGQYHLTVDGVGDKTGAYAFHLVGIESAQAVVPGTAVTGTLAAGTQAALYSVALSAGDRLYLQAASPATGGSYTLFDPAANRVWGQAGLGSDSGSVYTAGRSGTFWLSVEGASGATAALNYGFTLFRSAARSSALALGADRRGQQRPGGQRQHHQPGRRAHAADAGGWSLPAAGCHHSTAAPLTKRAWAYAQACNRTAY
jgi:hypothetical protein